jgi:hypothetical protein
MNKILVVIALLATGLSANASVIIGSGESFSTSFQLISDGDVFKETDAFWEVNLVFSAGPVDAAGIGLTLFENSDGTGQLVSGAFGFSNFDQVLFSGELGYFQDHDGSLTITNTGTGSVELTEIFVANFSGTLNPSAVAFATIVPSGTAVAAVPVPAAGWLMLSGLLGLVGVFRRNLRQPLQ